MTVGKKPVCRDCITEGLPGSRKAPYPGPRCASHNRERVKLNKETAHGRRLIQTYGITAEEYQRILAVQGGKCAICRRATGVRKRLSVDHDHAVAVADGHIATNGCPNCVRGLLCSRCNAILGHARDDVEFFERAIGYLKEWPSKR